jgi:hypothetical protein
LRQVQSNAGHSISEEIILPLPGLKTKTTSGSICEGDDGSDFFAENISACDFHDIESCLLALLYIYCSKDYLNYVREYLFNCI